MVNGAMRYFLDFIEELVINIMPPHRSSGKEVTNGRDRNRVK
jgi:hypothetical protein